MTDRPAQDFSVLLQPLQLRHLTLRNRIVFGAHTANMSIDGLPGDRHLGYYRERAIGGAAMIVVEPIPVHPTAVLTRGNFRSDDDAVIPGFRRITEAVHAEGAAILQQPITSAGTATGTIPIARAGRRRVCLRCMTATAATP